MLVRPTTTLPIHLLCHASPSRIGSIVHARKTRWNSVNIVGLANSQERGFRRAHSLAMRLRCWIFSWMIASDGLSHPFRSRGLSYDFFPCFLAARRSPRTRSFLRSLATGIVDFFTFVHHERSSAFHHISPLTSTALGQPSLLFPAQSATNSTACWTPSASSSLAPSLLRPRRCQNVGARKP